MASHDHVLQVSAEILLEQMAHGRDGALVVWTPIREATWLTGQVLSIDRGLSLT